MSQLTPLNNVESLKNAVYEWRAITDDPQFLVSHGADFRNKIVNVSFNIVLENQHKVNACFYTDHGSGYSEHQKIQLKLSVDGSCHQELIFSNSLISLRFDPLSQRGCFSISNFTMKILGDNAKNLPSSHLTSKSGLSLVTSESYSSQLLLEDQSLRQLVGDFEAWETKPLISIVMPTYRTPITLLRKALDSVLDQVYPYWELCIVDDNSDNEILKSTLNEYARNDGRIKVFFRNETGHISIATNSAINMATGDYITFLDHDDELHATALYFIAEVIHKNNDATLIYSDEDKLSIDGERFDPYFKTDLSYDLLLSQNMICHLAAYKAKIVKEVGCLREGYEGAQDYDLALRVLDLTGGVGIYHIPHVLYHWRIIPGSTSSSSNEKPYAMSAASKAIQDHLSRNKIAAQVEQLGLHDGFHRVIYQLPSQEPSVEIFVFADSGNFIGLIEDYSWADDYKNFKLTILVEHFKNIELIAQKLVNLNNKKFNLREYKSKEEINEIVSQSFAKYICFISGALVGLSQNWLRELVSVGEQKNVGCVGGKILREDETIFHAGIVIRNSGEIHYMHQNFPNHAPGYFGRAIMRCTFTAIGGGVMLIDSSVLKEAGGISERMDVSPFNDILLCLKVKSLGYRNVFTPFSEFKIKINNNFSNKFLGLIEINESGTSLGGDEYFPQSLDAYFDDISLKR